MSLNKGSLNKANQDQKLDIEYLFIDLIAGENITAKQIVMLSDVADNTVLVATSAARGLIVGVALHDALITETVKICVYGIVEVVAGEELYSGDVIGLGATAGRAYEGGAVVSGVGSVHKHTESLTIGNPDSTEIARSFEPTAPLKFVAETSGGSPTLECYVSLSIEAVTFAKDDHGHPIGGTIDNESAHTHSVYPAQTLGKALEYFTTGTTGKILVCLA